MSSKLAIIVKSENLINVILLMAVSNPLYKPIKTYTRNIALVATKILQYKNRKKEKELNENKC